MFLHDSRDPFYRAPAGAQPCGATVRLRLRAAGGKPDTVSVRVWDGAERFYPMSPLPNDGDCYEAVLTMPDTPRLLWYDFQARADGQFFWYGNAEDGLGGLGAPVYGQARSFQITVYDPAFAAPAWSRGAVWYQIFPDRFARGERGANLPLPEGRTYHAEWSEPPNLLIDSGSGDNVAHDFFGGTLSGIREKLPYLASLGVTALYLNPIFHAATNHRFDTTDWKRIDPALGTEDDFHALCDAAAALGVRIVLDGVFSHAGSESPFFRDARVREDSLHRDWFTFTQWPSVYKSWWGFQTLPEINKNSPEVRRYFLTGEDAVVKKWPRAGASGWRIDVADELPMDYLAQLRKSVKAAREDAIVIGEVWEDASNKVSYGDMRCYCLGDTLDGVMNYPLREAAIEFLTGRTGAHAFKRRMDSLYENYPAPFAGALLNVLGTHDRPRILNVLACVDGENLPRADRALLRLTKQQRELAKKRLALMLAIVTAMPGMPCVYYGDEAGMEGAADPYNRCTYPWDGEDAEILILYKEAIHKKKTVPALTDGTLALEALTDDVLVIARAMGGSAWVTAVNRSAEKREAFLGGKKLLLDGYGVAAWEEKG